MVKIYHYTSRENLEKAMLEKRLEPLTDPFSPYGKAAILHSASSRILDIINHDKYIVGIPVNDYAKWLKSVLLITLLNNHTSGEVLLELDIEDAKDAFIRDSYYMSPEYLLIDSGFDFSKTFKEQGIRGIMDSKMNFFRQCLETTIPYEQYLNNYRIPEIWIPKPVLSGNIKIIQQ
jgi:hypothetical protein